MQIAPTTVRSITGLSTFNASVDSAKAEDWLALTKFALLDLRWPLREIVLGVDIEGLHDHSPPDGRLGGATRLLPYLPWSVRPTLLAQVVTSGLSQDQLTSSLRSVRFYRSSYPPDATSFDGDGMLHYLKFDQEIAAGTFRPDFAGSIREYDRRFAGMSHVGAERVALLRELITLAQQRAVRVRTFLTPLHDSVRVHLEQHRELTRLRRETLATLQQLQREFPRTVTVADYTDVRSFGADPELFYDGAHFRPATGDLLTRALFNASAVHAVQ